MQRCPWVPVSRAHNGKRASASAQRGEAARSRGGPGSARAGPTGLALGRLEDHLAQPGGIERDARVLLIAHPPGHQVPGIGLGEEGDLAPGVREDDLEVTIRARLSTYKEQTEPVLTFFGAHDLVTEIDGTGDIEAVSQRLRLAIG